MHLLFGASLIVQIALAAHAYRHGRTSPWVWIILFFPLVGSMLYVFLFLLPAIRWSGGEEASIAEDITLRRVPRGPFAPAGERPDSPIPVESAAEIEIHAGREDCPDCETPLKLDEHRADTIAGRHLRVVVMRCPRCGALPVRYFEIHQRGRIASLQ